MTARITSPQSEALQALVDRLTVARSSLKSADDFPSKQLAWCAQAGVLEWFVPRVWQGQDWSELDLANGYIQLASACLTTAFVTTQLVGAITRLAACQNQPLQHKLLPSLIHGDSFATIGISHLTTSRRHLAEPVLRAEENSEGFLLNGYSPWVTGVEHAEHVVLGAQFLDGRQILVALPTHLPGVSVGKPPELVALSASGTGSLICDNVRVPREFLMAGPVIDVMTHGLAARTGGLQTSALALGLAQAALNLIESESEKRPALVPPLKALRQEWEETWQIMRGSAEGNPDCSGNQLRARANSLALRSSQASLAAAKGAGFMADHPAGRWCREALFFLVWSCPPSVLDANLCELAGMDGWEQ